jgi:hypothetical protein
MTLAFAQFQMVKSRPLPIGYDRLALVAAMALLVSATHAHSLTASGPIVISGQNGTVISGLKITSTTGPCISIINSRNITIKGSDIGPCGTNNSTANSRGIHISGGSDINIYDNYIHVENIGSWCDHNHDNVNISGKAARVMLQGNVIAYGHSNVMVWDVSDVSLVGNFLLNPRGTISCGKEANRRGNQFQAWSTDSSPNRNISGSSPAFRQMLSILG